jgi:hypothetical protein
MTLRPWKLIVAALAALALLAPAVRADVGDTDLDITQLHAQPTDLQAGGNPQFHLMMRFCDEGIGIPAGGVVETSPGHFRVTTAAPHEMVNQPGAVGGNVKVVAPSVPAANGYWNASAVDTTTIDLVNRLQPLIADDIRFARGQFLQTAPNYGCNATQQGASIRKFKLHLPPGFVGNPTALPACPIPLWKAGLCPPETILGHSISETHVRGNGVFSLPLGVPSAIFNIETLGLEPARLGTRTFPSEPPGPFPIIITLDTTNDYGLNSALIDIPRNLGGPIALVAEIDSVLCAQVPCKATADADPSTVAPVGDTRPFFRNPTSCKPAAASLDASSYHFSETALTAPLDVAATSITVSATREFPASGTLKIDSERIIYAAKTAQAFTGLTRGASGTIPASHATGAIVAGTDLSKDDHYPDPAKGDDPATSTFTPTNCEDVPFDATVGLTPADTAANAPSAQTVSIDYGHNFVDDPIWESALRDAYVTLPKGLALSPAGGIGLESCTPQQFGVDPFSGKQVDNDPVKCPPGSQIGTIDVETPVLAQHVPGKVFFGPVSGPGRPTATNPWKLYLLIEGAGFRIKLVGDTTVSEDGQISNVFLNQPEVPFEKFNLVIRGGERSVLVNPSDCNEHLGEATLNGWSGAQKISNPRIQATSGCAPVPFGPTVDEAGSNPEQAGANTVSRIVISRTDGQPDIRSLKLSLPVGAVGSLSTVPQCLIEQARAGACPEDSKIGTVKSTVGTGNALLTAAGSLYLAEPSVYGDAATLALVVPAKVGPIDLGQVVVLNRIMLRPTDSGIDAVTSDVPAVLGGVPLHVRRIEIVVDREGFFLNPTGCDTRTLTATFTAWDGQQSTSSMGLAAKGCDKLPFAPKLRLIAGAKGLTKTGSHPPLRAIVTQKSGEANILNSKVVLPDILRPNAVQFNVPGGLCNESQFALGTCPPLSHAGDAKVITPVLPFVLQGPVYVVQEVGSVLPKLYVVLRGRGLQVVLRARNAFQGIRTVNTFDGLPDVPQSYFELDVHGGKNGILNAFNDLCKASPRPFDVNFTGQNGKTVKAQPKLEVNGCGTRASSRGVSIASNRVKVSKKGIAKIKLTCRGTKACKGKLSLSAHGRLGSKSFSLKAGKSASVKVKLSKKAMRKLRKAKRLKATAAAGSIHRKLTLIAPKRR